MKPATTINAFLFILLVLGLTSGVCQAFTVSPPHTDYRQGYTGGCGASAACHTVDQGWFLSTPVDTQKTTDYTNFCVTCHNAAGEAHEKKVGSQSTNVYRNLTGFDPYTSYKGDSHSWKGQSGDAGTRFPMFTLSTSHMVRPGWRVGCQTCHQGMEKVSTVQNMDWKQAWSFVGDQRNYRLLGYTSTPSYLGQYVRVYRNKGYLPRPAYTRSKKQYLVSQSEYTYNPQAATVTFNATQSTSMRIYVDVAQPYFRAGNAANVLCLDCHNDRRDTGVSHEPGTGVKDNHPVTVVFGDRSGLTPTLKPSPDGNVNLEAGKVYCTSCHDPHNAASNDGQLLRNAVKSAICANCHMVNGFNGYSSAPLSDHSGVKHRTGNKPAALCLDCHVMHGSRNIMLVRNEINRKRITFRNFSGPNSFGNDNGSGVCEACHTATAHHKSDGTGTGHNTARNCLECHKHSAGFARSCTDCHSTAGPDVDDYVFGNEVKALVNTIEFNTSGHGRSANYPYTGNTGARKSCGDCHDSNVEHDISANPFRLKNPDTVALCSGCHPDMGNHDLAHVAQGNWGWTPKCIDCHDPHGDKGGITTSSFNGAMIQAKVAWQGSNTYGVPSGTPEAVDFPSSFNVSAFNWSSFVVSTGSANKGVCRVCHTDAGTEYFSRTVYSSHNSSGGACTACHRHGSGFRPGGDCSICHGVTGAEVDDYTYGNGTKATVNTTEFNTAGHGRTTNYPYTGNAGAAKSCDACHDDLVNHNVSTNPFRLKNADTSALCGGCHSNVANHDLAHVGQGTWGWTPKCVDCHDPHGDKGGISTSSFNGAMIQAKVVWQGSDSYGVPSGTPEAVDFPTRYNVSAFNWSSFVVNTGQANKGVCRVCHTEGTTNYFTRTAYSSHNSSGGACVGCHGHSAGFKPGGLGDTPCYSCHAGNSGPNIRALMGLGTSVTAGGKTSKHKIAYDNTGGSSCLVMCHKQDHVSGSVNITPPTELSLCYGSSCHNNSVTTKKTTQGRSIYVGPYYLSAKQHNYTTTMLNESGRLRYLTNCTKCHVPHGSDYYPNLRSAIYGKTTNGNAEGLCFGCHDGSVQRAKWNIKDLWNAGYPANRGHYDYAGSKRMGCVACHGPHGTSKGYMIKDGLGAGGNGPKRYFECKECHSGNGGSVYNVMAKESGSYGNFSAASIHDFGLNVAMGGYTVDQTCTGCHDPHYTKNARLLQDKIVFSSPSGVRLVAISTVTALIQAQGAISGYGGGWNKYCATCHVSMRDIGGQSPYRRHPVGVRLEDYSSDEHTYNQNVSNKPDVPLESGSVSCISCHYTHGSPKPSLLRFTNSTTPDNRQCLKCHVKGTFLGGGPGSHGGFLRYEGNCPDCHNMHTKANRKLLQESTESVLCYSCHGGGVGSRYNVWKVYSTVDPMVMRGTGGTFGRYSEFRGGNAHSMHDINDEASPAPGGVTTLHRCGTCHNAHGSKNYRILATAVNNVTGLKVTARVDAQGNFINYSTGFVKYCSACHTAYAVTTDGGGNWIRHPVGEGLDNYSSERFMYDNTTSYQPKVELEAGRTVSCVTCHYAHGSPADANLKVPGGRSVNICKTCHNRDAFSAGTPGSHAGFTGNDGSCSDCHSMHKDGNAKLLKYSSIETKICVNCHDNPGTSTSASASRLDVWKGNSFNSVTSWLGTGGSFGTYSPENGGNATSMHPVNSEATVAPGDSATVVHCGTCHDSHGSQNYRLLKKKLNGKDGISVTASMDGQGHTLAYGSGMSSFCTACHKTYGDYGSAAGYTRHPVNVTMTSEEMANYNHVQGRKYLPLESGNKVTCTTCHFAHGSPYKKMMRMPYDPELNQMQLCQACHAKGLDPGRNYQDVLHTHGGFNGNGGKCTACHYIHRRYDSLTSSTLNRKMLKEPDESRLCYSCHRENGGSIYNVWQGDSPQTPTGWDGTGGSFGSFYNTTSGGSIRSHHDINKTNSAAPGGTTTEHRCGTCHNPHGSNNYRIIRTTVNNVTGVHVYARTVGGGGAFGAYSSGMSRFCTACHASYGDTGSGVGGYRKHPVNRALTAQELANLTSSVLQPKVQLENGKVMCVSCHFAHGSPSYAMLRMKTYTSVESEMCQQCHKKGYNASSGEQVRYTHGGFNGNRSNCGMCHTTHKLGNKKLLVESKESKLCDNCHAGIGKFNEFKSRTSVVRILIDKPSRFNVFSSVGNSFGNYSVGGGDVVSWHEVDGTHTAPGGKTLELKCGKCHNPHGGDNFVMLRDSIEGVNNIQVFGRLSSTGPFNTYSSGFGTFCSACHTRLTKCISVINNVTTITRHPVDFKLKDKQYYNWSTTDIQPRMPLEAGKQVTCITCHNSHGSKNHFLQRLGGNSMCQQCHRR